MLPWGSELARILVGGCGLGIGSVGSGMSLSMPMENWRLNDGGGRMAEGETV